MVGKEYFDKLNEQYNNPYITTTIIAKQAREKAKELNYAIADSRVLAAVLTGEQPNIVDIDEFADAIDLFSPYDLLNYVSDERIANSAKKSLDLSKKNHKLTYVYDKTLTEEEKARVEVITNMIFYKLD